MSISFLMLAGCVRGLELFTSFYYQLQLLLNAFWKGMLGLWGPIDWKAKMKWRLGKCSWDSCSGIIKSEKGHADTLAVNSAT